MPDLIESVNGHAPQQIGVNLAAGVFLVGSRLSLYNSISNSKVNRVCLSFRRAQRGEISLWPEISHFVRNDRPLSAMFCSVHHASLDLEIE
jgi:hypothetical protein